MRAGLGLTLAAVVAFSAFDRRIIEAVKAARTRLSHRSNRVKVQTVD